MATGLLQTGRLEEGVQSVAIGGTGDYTALPADYAAANTNLTGVLTGARGYVLPLTTPGARWRITNSTTGDFALTVKGATGTGVIIGRGMTEEVYTDGTNFLPYKTNLSGLHAGNVAESNVIGGIPVVHLIPVPAGATGNVDLVLTHKTRILDVHLIKKSAAGGGAGTIQLFNGSDAITNAMSIDVADQIIVRPTTINDAFYDVAAGGTLRATRTRTASTDETALVVVIGVRML